MGDYIKTVILTVLSVSVISYLFPKNTFGKFANIIASIIVTTVLLIPAAKLGFGDKFKVDTLPTDTLTNSENAYVKEEFEEQLAEKLEQELYKKTNNEFSVEITASFKEESVSIEEVGIFPYTAEYVEICASYLGIEEERIVQK